MQTTLPTLTITRAAREAHVRPERIWSLIADGTLDADTTTFPSRPVISRASFHRFFGRGPEIQTLQPDPESLRGLVREVLAAEVPAEVRRALARLADAPGVSV